MIQFEQEIIGYLNLPSIPKKKWDGKKSFKDGIIITKLISGRESYAIATFDEEKDERPRIKKVFAQEPFTEADYTSIKVVPDYMQTDGVDDWDLDDKSKDAVKNILQEVEELEMEGVDTDVKLPENEYSFDFITNDDEAKAYIRSYNQSRGLSKKTRIPSTHEGLVAKLATIYTEQNSKTKWNKRNK